MANIVSLAQAKAWLRYPPAVSADDAAIQLVINAADEVVEYECEDILPHRYDEYYSGGDCEIFLKHSPILSVENVEEGWGFISFELDYVEANSPPAAFSIFAFSVDGHEMSKITRRTAGNVVIPFRPGVDNIHVQYTTGRATIPGSIIIAELELIAHWWQNSQLRATAMAGTNISYDATLGQTYTRDTESGTQNLNIGVPMRILEMLKRNRHTPFIA